MGQPRDCGFPTEVDNLDPRDSPPAPAGADAPPGHGSAVAECLQAVRALTEAVSGAGDITAIYDAALDALQHSLGADRASVLVFDPDGILRYQAGRGLSDECRDAMEGHSPWAPDTRSPQPVLVADVETDAGIAHLHAALRAGGIRSLAMVPLVSEGRLLGQFMLCYGAPRRFTPDEVQMAQIIAGHIAFALGRRRVEEAMRESEERFRTLVEATSDWIWEVDADDFYTYTSPKVKEFLGYEPAEVMGKTPFDLMPAEEAERVRAAYHAVKARREPVSGVQNTNRHKDGRLVVLETSAVPILDGAGCLRGYRGVDRDITERRRIEDAQRFIADASTALASSLDTQDALRKLARLSVPILGDWCIIYTITDEETIERVAVAWANANDEPLARRLMSFPAPNLESVRAQLGAFRSGRPQIFDGSIPEALLQALATNPAHLDAVRALGPTSALTVPFNARGRMLGLAQFFFAGSGRRYQPWHLTLADEVAWRAGIAVDNARLYKEAREANAAKDQFLAVLSHELRNPLAPILASVTILRHAARGDERVCRTVDIVERNAKLQARLVNDLLDLSRIGRGKIQLQQAPVCLSTIAQSAVQTERPDADAAGLTLTFAGPDGVWVQGDFDRLQQVVVNLLSNAIKFTPPPGHVHVQVEERENTARLTVTDTGIGIPDDLLPRLFRMFEQGEVAGQRKVGLGIGLALVKAITYIHGGRVWVESAGPGKGSSFHVEMPLTTPPAPPPETGNGGNSHLEVLLVEDNPDTRSVLADSLATMGHHVRAVETAEEGLAELDIEHPDVILSDIQLPGMDGYEFLRRAHALPGMDRVPAFAITGFGQAEDVRRARDAGYSGHFTKPVDVAVLGQRIREWTRGS